MTMGMRILGKMSLARDASAVPTGGLTVSPLRVEISPASDPASAWIAELGVLGDLPWKRGEERQVEVRIMSDEFRDYVTVERPMLIVKRGYETIGNLVLG